MSKRYITKEQCEDYYKENIDKFDKKTLEYFGGNYVQMLPVIDDMGGWANFRHYHCNQKHMRAISDLQSQIQKRDKILRQIKSIWNDYAEEDLCLVGENIEDVIDSPEFKEWEKFQTLVPQ